VRWVRLEQRPEQLQAQMHSGLASRLLVQDANAAVARFDGRAGIFRYETVELIRFSDQGVTFKYLRGPFQRCVERFAFVPLVDGSYAIEHQGAFVMRGGVAQRFFGDNIVNLAMLRHRWFLSQKERCRNCGGYELLLFSSIDWSDMIVCEVDIFRSERSESDAQRHAYW